MKSINSALSNRTVKFEPKYSEELPILSSLIKKDADRILIVDDEIFNILAVKTVLENVVGLPNPDAICD